MERGAIIAFMVSDRWTYGQVFYSDSEQLDVKLLGLGDFITLYDWKRSQRKESLQWISHEALWEKTIVFTDERKRRPNIFSMAIGYYIRGYRYKKTVESQVNPWPPYLYTRTSWEIRKPLKGTVFADGMFVPHAYQWKTKPFIIDRYNLLKYGIQPRTHAGE